MDWPFIILGLPRSRTAWLAKWLSLNNRAIGHDLAIEANSCQGFLDALWPLTGTAETAAMLAHSQLRRAMPTCKIVTIRRPIAQVEASLSNLGVGETRAELELRDWCLDQAEAAGATRITFDDLADVNCCAWLWEHLLNVPFDFNWWQLWSGQNVQVDFQASMVRQAARASQLETLRLEALAGGPEALVRVGPEPFDSVWADGEAMGKAHYAEANGGQLANHPLAYNLPLLRQLEACGAFRVFSARVNGQLAGYTSWTISPDAESLGVVLATMGPTYVTPEAPKALALGRRLREHSTGALRRLGVHALRFHSALAGRGAALDRYYQLLGAVPLPHQWELWIGNSQDA